MILHPSYFIDVVSLVQVFHNDEKITFEKHDSYLKQTYRNRCYIVAANGKLGLNIPIIHQKKGGSVAYKSIVIDHAQSWSTQHLKSIKSAYRSSPFYDYYEDDLNALFYDIPELLLEWNMKTYQWILKQFQIPIDYRFTNTYLGDVHASRLINAKESPLLALDPYIQVFQEKHGFINGLSSLDLLFNLGPSARVYLQRQEQLLQRLP